MFSSRGGFFHQMTPVGGSGSFIASFNTLTTPAVTLTNSSGANIYFVGMGSGATNDILAIKMNGSGNVIWQEVLSGNNDVGLDAVLDSSENIYVAGYTNASGAGGNDGYVAKLNTDGNILWQRTLGTNYNSDRQVGISIDPSEGNVYTAMNGNNAAYMIKYQSDGTLSFQVQVDASADTAYDTVSVSGNSYVATQGGNEIYLTKVNTSGTTQSSRKLTQSGQTLVPIAMASDSTGNVYISGIQAGANLVVIKCDSNCNVLSSVSFANVTGSGGITVDASDNIYVSGSGTNVFWYSKLYNSNLQPVWQQTVSGTTFTAYKMTYANNFICMSGRANVGGGFQSIVMKLSANSTTTGTYGTYTIANVSYTTTSITVTSAAANNVTTSSLTGGTPTLVATTSTYTQTLTPV